MKLFGEKKKYEPHILGKRGEDAAVKYLKKNGYKIISRNERTSCGEIDIICRDKKYIVFAEVKSRRCDGESPYGRPSDAVDRKKREHIIDSARSYLRLNPSPLYPRFDIIEVYFGRENETPDKIEYIQNAFGEERRR